MGVLGLLLPLILNVQVHAETSASYLDLNLRQNRYIGTVPAPTQESNYTLFAGDLNLETQSPGFAYKFNPRAQGDFNNKDEFYFGVPEAYVQPRKIAPWFNLTIGRQRRVWSRADEEFNLGLWQPQLRWDYLQPVQQGLTGVFFDWRLSKEFSFTFFTSPLHFPDQGPQYRLNNGRFESSNRWFEQPHTSFRFAGNNAIAKDRPLNFEIDKPTEEEIVMHSSFGLGMRYEMEDGIWSSLNYAYKPRNQIHLGIDTANGGNIGQPQSALEVTAKIHPKIIKHHVLTWEMGFDRGLPEQIRLSGKLSRGFSRSDAGHGGRLRALPFQLARPAFMARLLVHAGVRARTHQQKRSDRRRPGEILARPLSL